MSTCHKELHVYPTETPYSFVFRNEKIYLEKGDERIVFNSFFEMEQLRMAIEQALQKAVNYGLLYEESNT